MDGQLWRVVGSVFGPFRMRRPPIMENGKNVKVNAIILDPLLQRRQRFSKRFRNFSLT